MLTFKMSQCSCRLAFLHLVIYWEFKEIRMAQFLPAFRGLLPLPSVCVSPFCWIMFICNVFLGGEVQMLIEMEC